MLICFSRSLVLLFEAGNRVIRRSKIVVIASFLRRQLVSSKYGGHETKLIYHSAFFSWENLLFIRQLYGLLGLSCLGEEDVVEVGHITHFFSKISVAVLELTAPLAVGDRILIKGPSTDFEQPVESMQIERVNIERAEAGQSIGLKTAQLIKVRDVVYKKL